MRIQFDDLTVYFPYDYVYPEQFDYMYNLKRSLETGSGQCMLEMPTGTGKTVSLLSMIMSYQLQYPEQAGKLIYCTRTVQEMDKVMEEIKRVWRYIESQKSKELNGCPDMLCVCLTARRNLCIHKEISQYESGQKVDSLCRNLTATWVREDSEKNGDIELCKFFEKYHTQGTDANLTGIWGIDDLKRRGKDLGWCPYFLSRHLINLANVVVFNYQYLIDPKISNLVSREIGSDCIVVFDEAHNIDNICIEALSVDIDRRMLNQATRNLTTLQKEVRTMQENNEQRLQDEYNKLLDGLRESAAFGQNTDAVLGNPILNKDILAESVPGNIRKAKHFVNFMRTVIEHLKSRMTERRLSQETTQQFLETFRNRTRLEHEQMKALRFCHDRINSLFRTLRITDLDRFTPITNVSNFASLVATYQDGFSLLIEPYDSRTPHAPDPIIRLCCVDASIAMRPVFEKFDHVVITSGTLSPIDFYPKILSFDPKVRHSLTMTLSRECIRPIIVTKGADQIPISSKYEMRKDHSVVNNYGQLIIDLCAQVPDGIVVFFTSYAYMEEMITQWNDMGILQKIQQQKLLFLETQDIVETSLALDSYRKACDCGRGAVFLSIARGKVAEGVDFDSHYGRCVVMMGIPYQYAQSRVLGARLEFMSEKFDISDNEFLTFDALRQAAQCVGRVIRSKLDYGLMIFADSRYARSDRRRKLPRWIQERLREDCINVSTDVAVEIASKFCKEMAQPHDKKNEIGFTMLSNKHLKKRMLVNAEQNQV